ncbi:MAG: hypothetical protein RL721_1795 [Candidatus Eisenbacteria bacterium]
MGSGFSSAITKSTSLTTCAAARLTRETCGFRRTTAPLPALTGPIGRAADTAGSTTS